MHQKTQTGWAKENTCMYVLPLNTLCCLTPQIVHNYFIVKLIMFPLQFATVIIFQFLTIDCEK